VPSLPLRIGSRLRFEGEAHALVGWQGPAVRLRSESGSVQLIATEELLDAPDFEILDVEYGKEAAETSTLIDDLPNHTRKKAEKRLAHLKETGRGY